ncbi:hypothetical protein ACFV0H_25565 [Streptomyces erythrochromogenes]|uniref:hypothetical protein n=1 Tax=Streptomyces erythrochromogenes TaxID=285574 RepID=UPI0036B5256A
MPLPLLLLVIAGGAVWLATQAVQALWRRVLQWAEQSLLPWAEARFPELTEDLRLAYLRIHELSAQKLDEVRRAWLSVRKVLLDQTAELVRQPNGHWALRLTSVVLDASLRGQPPRKAQQEVWTDLGELSEAELARLRPYYENGPLQVIRTRDNELFGTEGSPGNEKGER